jgi:hypothetical protein
MSVVTQLYFHIVEEINYMFQSFSRWAIIRVRLEYRRKLTYYSVDMKNGGTRSRFTMSGDVCSYIYRVWCYRRCSYIYRDWCYRRCVAIIQGVVLQEMCSYIYRVWCYRRCVAIYTGCGATGGV